MTAIRLLGLSRKYTGANRQQIAALPRLAPIQIQSKTSLRGKSRISKSGSGEARKRRYETTLSAARCNPKVHMFQRQLKEEGKPDKAARIAAARTTPDRLRHLPRRAAVPGGQKRLGLDSQHSV